ncbi:hypothetical protein DBT_1779 [Dissulfuribacter thermophilus]|uniref:Uncharacterized protein n=1 Tax=Dissulfuribacter thermophilus TaxID=1156395 RepID=A0A1B9F443_9BACT|nr:hypothetical protein DBT_1779 [Dissulfuribacter thermophilus]
MHCEKGQIGLPADSYLQKGFFFGRMRSKRNMVSLFPPCSTGPA